MDSSVRESASFIAKNSLHVKINDEKVREFCEKMISTKDLPQVDFRHPLHPNCTTDTDFIDWIFVIDSLNFCFWKPTDQPQWNVTYNGVTYTGYFALCAVLKKAKDNGLNIFDPKVASKLTLDEFKDIMKGDNDILPNLVEERLAFLTENSNILISKYQGSFQNVVQKANRSAKRLLSLIAEDFPSFRDEKTFLGRKVAFYKRAQILVADLHFCVTSGPVSELPHTTGCIFLDIDSLTMFADYRVPQALKYFGILEYSAELMTALNQVVFTDPEVRFEIEIRGNSIEAVERIVRTMNHLIESPHTTDLSPSERVENHSSETGLCPENKTNVSSSDKTDLTNKLDQVPAADLKPATVETNTTGNTENTGKKSLSTVRNGIKITGKTVGNVSNLSGTTITGNSGSIGKSFHAATNETSITGNTLSTGKNRINAVTVDVFLWNYRREYAQQMESEPYHRVVSVYY